MPDPTDSFFIGRALAQAITDKFSETITIGLSELGKFDAEQREKLKAFTQEVLARAEQETGNGHNSSGTATPDLQETIDDLRAEIARMRAELQRYRNRSVS
jgi:molecular chaperone GrpE (heat shock protein)